MDLDVAPEDLAFRDEVRAFIADAFDDDMRAKLAQSKNNHLDKEAQVRWLKRLGEKGWIAPDWPEEYGGTGWSLGKKYVFDMEMALAGAPSTSNMGLRMCAPVVMAFGTPEQKAQHLPKILTTDVWWCQGYSEPGSGSDLASLALKAELDGDHYVLNGSKTWTTLAQWADWMFCLVRTSNEDIRQKGISFLLIDMRTPGITIRPIPTLDGPAEGEQEINETFFDNVRVPVSNRIGKEGEGWTYAKYLLQFERGNAYAPGLQAQLKKVRKIANLERSDGGGSMMSDPDFRKKLSEVEIKVEALNAAHFRRPRQRRRHGRRLLDAEAGRQPDAAGCDRTRAGGGRHLRPALRAGHLGDAPPRRQHLPRRPRLCGHGRPTLLQLPQNLDLCGVERDPAQHHGEAGAWSVGGLFRPVRSVPAPARTDPP